MSVICRAIRRASVRAGVAGVLLLASLVAARPVSAAAVVLRYHFIAGQSYGYRAVIKLNMRVDLGTKSPDVTSESESFTMRYHILSVDASGDATARVTTSPITVHVSANGQTHNATAAAQTEMIHLNVNGSATVAQSNRTVALNAQSFGTLPTGPVTPGAHWASRSVFTLGVGSVLSIPPIHLTAHNTFSGYMQSSGQQAAVLNTTASPQIISSRTLQGRSFLIHMTSQVTERSLFGLRDQRVLTSNAHEDMRLAVHGTSSGVPSTVVREHIILDTTLQPL